MTAVHPDYRHLLDELLDAPFGPHSAGAAELLAHLRAGPVAGRLVLVATVPHREWRLARLPDTRFGPIAFAGEERFHSLVDGERAIIRRRWEERTAGAHQAADTTGTGPGEGAR